MSLGLAAAALLLGAWFFGVPGMLSGLASGDSGFAAMGWSAVAVYLTVFIALGAVGVPPVLFMLPARFVWSDPVALSVSLAGGMGAAVTGFWLSRYLAREALAKRIPPRFHRYDRQLRKHGFKTVIALRLLFFLMPPVNWLLGLSRLRTGTFLLATLIGALPGTIFFTFVGKGLIQVVLEGRPTVILAIVGLVAAVSAAWLIGARLLGNGAEGGDDSDREGLLPGLFWDSAGRFLRLSWRTLFPPAGFPRPSLKRLALMALFLPVFGILMAVHWLAFFVDECFFGGYHEIAVSGPLFVVGIPRSGTTFLHRVLARDSDQYTVFTLWELMFAPSVFERKVVFAVAALDRRIGRPLHRLVGWLETRFAGGMADIHRLSLTAAEEDFVFLLPVLACFILVVAFPFADDIQDLAYFDDRVPEQRKRQLMAYYRRALQKHLYVHGADKIILSKNVSFTPLLDALQRTFPDCRVVACMRDPTEAVLSQISSMEAPWRLFGNRMDHRHFRDRWMNTMQYSYRHLADMLDVIPEKRCYLVDMTELQHELSETVIAFYRHFGLTLSGAYAQKLRQEQDQARSYRSRHVYAPEDYDLSLDVLHERFGPLYQRLRQRLGAGSDAISTPNTPPA